MSIESICLFRLMVEIGEALGKIRQAKQFGFT